MEIKFETEKKTHIPLIYQGKYYKFILTCELCFRFRLESNELNANISNKLPSLDTQSKNQNLTHLRLEMSLPE